MDAKDWYMLTALYEKRTITKASEALYISQPALTKRIKLLENEFNVQIITRSRKGIHFTQEGEYLYNYAKDMITSLQKTKDALNNMSSKSVSGLLRLGASFNFAHNYLPYTLKAFSQKFPLVKTQIQTGYSSDIIDLLREESIQIAIVRGDIAWNGPQRRIKSENIYLVSKDKIDLTDLPNLPRIDYKTDPSLKKQLNQWWNEMYNSPPTISIEVDNSRTCVRMIEQGLGFGILPQFSLDQKNDFYLENLSDKDGKPLVRDTWVIYQEESATHSTIKKFVEFIDEQFN